MQTMRPKQDKERQRYVLRFVGLCVSLCVFPFCPFGRFVVAVLCRVVVSTKIRVFLILSSIKRKKIIFFYFFFLLDIPILFCRQAPHPPFWWSHLCLFGARSIFFPIRRSSVRSSPNGLSPTRIPKPCTQSGINVWEGIKNIPYTV
jgi:hypothetical protein